MAWGKGTLGGGIVKDPGGTVNVSALALVDSTNTTHRLYILGAGPPLAGMGSNGDIAIVPSGAVGARMYAKAAGAWTAYATP